jgi:hypothetical protein
LGLLETDKRISDVKDQAGNAMLGGLSRREMLRCAAGAAAGATLTALPAVAIATFATTADREIVREFPFGAVRLTGGPLKMQFDRNHAHYLALSNDRLLKVFRQRVGLPMDSCRG